MVFAKIDEKEEIQSLLLAVQVKTGRGLPTRLASRCLVYGGILQPMDGKDQSVPGVLNSLDMACKSVTMFTEIRNIMDTRSFKDEVIGSGYYYYDYLNYLLSIDQDPKKIFQSFSRTRRQNIKHLEEKGLITEEVHERDDVQKIYDVLKITYSRIRIPLADISLFEAAFDVMKPLGMAKFYLAKTEKEVVAAAVALFYKKTIYLWYLGTKTEMLKINPASLIVWDLAKWGSQNGYVAIDFLGAGRPEEPYGVREFKKRFGGNEVNYGRYQKVYSPLLLKASEKAYGIYRKFL